MKKSKLIIVSILAIAALSTATACAGKKNETPKTPVPASAETTAASTEKEETAAEQTEAGDEAKDAESKKSGQMTGVLEENKGFIFTIISDEDGESYVFSLDDEKSLDGIKDGDKIIVSYEGGDPADRDSDCVVTKVEKAK